jgi:hypothetical protein
MLDDGAHGVHALPIIMNPTESNQIKVWYDTIYLERNCETA